jgi:O-methyltransferase
MRRNWRERDWSLALWIVEPQFQPPDPMISFVRRFLMSRWAWALAGITSPAKARALFVARPKTMTSLKRSRALWDVSSDVIRQGVAGAFVECGVWRGGSAAIMGRVILNHAEDRKLDLFDSFQGLPEPNEIDGVKAAVYSGNKSSGLLAPIGQCQADEQSVRQYLCEDVGLPESMLRFHVGWFQDTIPQATKEIGPIAVLRLDGDWYESTQVCLEHLYPLLSPGGIVILDDYYYWEGCAKAADEYRAAHEITSPIIKIDTEACYWRKA